MEKISNHNKQEELAQPKKSPAELEKKFSAKNTLNALAILAATTLTSGIQNAEAGVFDIEVNSPTISALKSGLQKFGVNEFNVVKGFGVGIKTEKGSIDFDLSSMKNTETAEEVMIKKLEGINPNQFINEIYRQNTDKIRIKDNVEGTSVNISPYAQEVLSENHISYKQGILTNNHGHEVSLLGGTGGRVEGNKECKVKGVAEFNNYLIATCTEFSHDANGLFTGYLSVKYKINGADLSVEEIKDLH